MKILKISVVLILSASLAVLPLTASEVPSGGEMMVDVIFVRPLSLVSCVFGTALFLVSLPFTIPSGSVKQSGKRLVLYPLKFTFTRKLGSFPGYSEELNYESD